MANCPPQAISGRSLAGTSAKRGRTPPRACVLSYFVIDRSIVIDPATLLRLTVGLLGAVFLFLSFVAIRHAEVPRGVLPTMTAVAIVVGVWVFVPETLAVGSYRLPIGVRQAGLATGAGAVIARYLVLRRRARKQRTGALNLLATPLLGVCLVLTSANWLVAVAAGLMVGTDLVRRAGESAQQETEQSDHSPGDE